MLLILIQSGLYSTISCWFTPFKTMASFSTWKDNKASRLCYAANTNSPSAHTIASKDGCFLQSQKWISSHLILLAEYFAVSVRMYLF
jgi:hypothetical protein